MMDFLSGFSGFSGLAVMREEGQVLDSYLLLFFLVLGAGISLSLCVFVFLRLRLAKRNGFYKKG